MITSKELTLKFTFDIPCGEKSEKSHEVTLMITAWGKISMDNPDDYLSESARQLSGSSCQQPLRAIQEEIYMFIQYRLFYGVYYGDGEVTFSLSAKVPHGRVINTFAIYLRNNLNRIVEEELQEWGSKFGMESESLQIALQSDDPFLRWAAAIGAGRHIKSKSVVSALIQLVENDNDLGVMIAALWALIEIGDAKAVPILSTWLPDSRLIPPFHEKIATALGNMRDPRAVEVLIQSMNTQNASMRGRVVEALGKIGGSRAVEVILEKALRDKVEDVRTLSAQSLKLICNDHVMESLISALNDEDSDTQKHAAESLGIIGETRAVGPLVKALKDGNKKVHVRISIVEALGELGGDDAIEPLLGALHDEDADVRERAIEVLGKIGDSRAIDPLAIVLGDKNEKLHVRKRATEALGNIANSRATQILAEAVWADMGENVRGNAAFALLGSVFRVLRGRS